MKLSGHNRPQALCRHLWPDHRRQGVARSERKTERRRERRRERVRGGERGGEIYGDECKFGGGKVLRDGMGQAAGEIAADCLDCVITNAL
eukprot:761756-Hanusia_phi.AAC.4